MAKVRRIIGLAALGALAFAGLSAYTRRAIRESEDLEPESAGAPGSFVDVDGVRVHYVDAGQGDPVVLIHGWNGSTFSFRHTVPELARQYRVVAVDLKGYGFSECPEGGDYSLTAQADLVAAVMERLGIELAAVLGHSMGGGVAMRLAARYPDRVSKLILVDSVSDRELGRMVRISPFARPVLPIVGLVALRAPGVTERILRSMTHDPAFVTEEVIEGYFRPMRMRGHFQAQAAQMAGRRQEEPFDAAHLIQPTLVFSGEHDRWLPPSTGEALAGRIPNVRFDLVPSAGHLPLEEQPEYCNRALLAFLSSDEARAPQAAPDPSTIEAPRETQPD